VFDELDVPEITVMTEEVEGEMLKGEPD